MRPLTSHTTSKPTVGVIVTDEPAPGNRANHEYEIQDENQQELGHISFQNGPVGEQGINGVTNEALLAIVEDRLLGFQDGDFACRANALALTNVQQAMMWLLNRTREREQRGVEGTNVH